jgi:hypothetical protein
VPGAAPLRRWSAGGVAAAAAVAAVAATAAAGLWRFTYDDAFVTYRYAANLAAGRGLAFNPGEPVLGTTAPGWAVLLGLAARASDALGLDGLDAAAWGTLLGALSLAVVAGFLPLAALRRAPPPWPWAFPLLLTALAFTQPWCLQMLGAETYPVLALGVAAAWLALGPRGEERRRIGEAREADVSAGVRAARDTAAGDREPGKGRHEIAAGLLFALAMMLRLDAAAGALALGLALWAWRRRLPWRYGLAGLLPLAPWLGWLEARFGHIVPATLEAKRSELAEAGGRLAAAVDYTRAEWHWLHRDLPRPAALWLLALAAAGAGLLAWSLLRRRAPAGPRAATARPPVSREPAEGRSTATAALPGPPTSPEPVAGRSTATGGGILRPFLPLLICLLSWLALHELAYRLAGVPFAPWYHLHLVLAILALAAGAGLGLGTLAARRHLLPAALALLLLFPVLVPGAAYLAATWGRPPDGRQALHAAVARYLRETSPAGSAVAAVEIGALAYFADRPVLDLVGMVDPAVVTARREGRLAELVAAREPHYLLVPPHFRQGLLGPLLAQPEIAGSYRPAAHFTVPGYSGGTVTLYERHPLRFAPAEPPP